MKVTCNWTEGMWRKIDGKATIIPRKVNFEQRFWEGEVAATTVIGAKVQAAIKIAKEQNLKAVFVCNLDLDNHDQVTIWELNEETQNFYAKGVR
jgi:hypothetical protein